METMTTLEAVIESESKAIPQLFGISEFARFLGWYKQKIHTYAARGLLPEPVSHIGTRPVWTRTQAYKFAIEKGLPYYEQPFEPNEK